VAAGVVVGFAVVFLGNLLGSRGIEGGLWSIF